MVVGTRETRRTDERCPFDTPRPRRRVVYRSDSYLTDVRYGIKISSPFPCSGLFLLKFLPKGDLRSESYLGISVGILTPGRRPENGPLSTQKSEEKEEVEALRSTGPVTGPGTDTVVGNPEG